MIRKLRSALEQELCLIKHSALKELRKCTLLTLTTVLFIIIIRDWSFGLFWSQDNLNWFFHHFLMLRVISDAMNWVYRSHRNVSCLTAARTFRLWLAILIVCTVKKFTADSEIPPPPKVQRKQQCKSNCYYAKNIAEDITSLGLA
jgi:hypothetical protein